MTDILTAANALICAAIALRIIVYRRDGSRYRPLYSVLAYLCTLAAGAVPIATLFGHMPWLPAAAAIVLNLTLLLALWRVRGNLAKLIRKPAP